MLRIDSLSVGMRPGWLCHHDCVRFAQRLADTLGGLFTMPIRVFTMPIPLFTIRRSWRSRCADPRVHDVPKPAPGLASFAGSLKGRT
ncbi:MAG TPA: hypothetical protein VGL81_13270 [Polyangiaceae bacterium]